VSIFCPGNKLRFGGHYYIRKHEGWICVFCAGSNKIMPMTWEDLAACAGMDTEMFFSRDGGGNKGTEERDKARTARETCRGCPVRLDCLEDSIEHGDQYGIFGGMTPQERNAYAKEHDLI
jgi:WhiB family redox-sensing transcriptional regulator